MLKASNLKELLAQLSEKLLIPLRIHILTTLYEAVKNDDADERRAIPLSEHDSHVVHLFDNNLPVVMAFVVLGTDPPPAEFVLLDKENMIALQNVVDKIRGEMFKAAIAELINEGLIVAHSTGLLFSEHSHGSTYVLTNFGFVLVERLYKTNGGDSLLEDFQYYTIKELIDFGKRHTQLEPID